MRPFINMPSFVLLVLLTNIKYDEYQKKSCENVPLRGALKPKNVTQHKNRYLPSPYSFIALVASRNHFVNIYLCWCWDVHDLFTNSTWINSKITCRDVMMKSYKGAWKIPNYTCRQSLNYGSYLGNHNSVIRPLIIMKNYLLVVLLTINKCDNYQKKQSEDVP